MKTLTIRTEYPCCGRPARLRAIEGVPSETYARRCRECETRWWVQRTKLPERVASVRIDRLDWLDTKSREYVKKYG